MDHIPNWLIIFMSVFVPVCFTSKMFKTAKDQQEMIKIQYKTFKLQTLASFISYTITLIVVLVYVNSPCTFPDFRYNQEIILSNQEFNVYGVGILVMGSLSLLLSMTPKCSMMLCCCQIKYDPAQVNNNAIQKINEKDTFGTMFKVLWSLLIMAIVVTPVILPPLILNRSLSTYIDPSYIFFKPSINETRIIQATTIEPFKGTLEGYLKYFMSTNDPSESRNTGTNKTGIGINRKFPDLNTEKDVIVISRKHWDERKDQILLTNPLGIIIIDNQVLRPSSPLPTFQNQDLIGPPIVLVRQEDGHHFTEDLDGGQFLMQIWMTSKAWMVYDPDWLCDTLYSCLSANFKEGFISGKIGPKHSYMEQIGLCLASGLQIRDSRFASHDSRPDSRLQIRNSRFARTARSRVSGFVSPDSRLRIRVSGFASPDSHLRSRVAGVASPNSRLRIRVSGFASRVAFGVASGDRPHTNN
jgi:hypothetical protein